MALMAITAMGASNQGTAMTPSTSNTEKPALRDRLRAHGLRPTRQRIAMARLLLDCGNRHVSADELFLEAQQAGVQLAYTTVYNILHQFTSAGLIREVVVEAGRTWFDTNIEPHIHVMHEDSGEIQDIAVDPGKMDLSEYFTLPAGKEICDVDIIIRVRNKKSD